MITRRTLVASLPLLGAAPAFALSDRFAPLRKAIATIEHDAGGPLGIALHDSATGERFLHRAGQRFPMCSTFKLLLAAKILKTREIGRPACRDMEEVAACPRDEAVKILADDIVAPSPFSKPLVGGFAKPLDLAQAMVTLSDNGATNAALRAIVTPAELTRWIRGLGDPVTRLDRNEPAMNSEDLSDPRDTTSPSAMLALSRALLSGRVLRVADRDLLLQWMADSQTGKDMIRAGLPAGWKEAHKTGASEWRARNIVSVITPPSGKRIWVAAYLFAAKSELAERNRHFPALGRAIAESVG